MPKPTLDPPLNHKANVPTRAHILKELKKARDKKADRHEHVRQYLTDLECPEGDAGAILDDLLSYPE